MPQILFVLLLIVNLAVALFAPGDDNFDALMQFLSDQLQLIGFSPSAAQLTPSDIPLTRGNFIFIGFQTLLFFFNALIAVLYTGAYAAERIGQPASLGLRSMVRSIPKLILLVLALIIPALLSSFFMWLPIIVILCGVAFTPLLFSEKRLPFGSAIKQSWQLTRGHKLSIFASFFFLNAINRVIALVVGFMAPRNEMILTVLSVFLTVLFTLMKGRLLGLMYVFYTRQVTVLGSGFLVMADAKNLFEQPLKPLPDDVFVPEIKEMSQYQESGRADVARRQSDRTDNMKHSDQSNDMNDQNTSGRQRDYGQPDAPRQQNVSGQQQDPRHQSDPEKQSEVEQQVDGDPDHQPRSSSDYEGQHDQTRIGSREANQNDGSRDSNQPSDRSEQRDTQDKNNSNG
ncbi:MAG TPA: hypothetical protein GX717_00815 [Clostridiaceae bacterium]|nr:hypothetical protein [Clostridiaceae bacterium]